METSKILTADFIDILFDGRNKEYGAYELRTKYSKRMWQALGSTLLLVGVIAAGAYLKNSYAKRNSVLINMSPDVNISAIPPEPEVENLPPPIPPPPQKIDIPKIQTIKLTTPLIVDDKDVNEPPPSQTDIAESKISTITQLGVKDIGLVEAPKQIDKDKGIIVTAKVDDNPEKIFEKVEIDAKYPGGAGAWKNFLERNLRGETPVDNSAMPGTYTVVIQFIVDKQGHVSDIKALTNLGYGMETEAMRVIKRSGRWTPAIQNGNNVTAYRKQPITFRVLEQ